MGKRKSSWLETDRRHVLWGAPTVYSNPKKSTLHRADVYRLHDSRSLSSPRILDTNNEISLQKRKKELHLLHKACRVYYRPGVKKYCKMESLLDQKGLMGWQCRLPLRLSWFKRVSCKVAHWLYYNIIIHVGQSNKRSLFSSINSYVHVTNIYC